MDTRTIHHLANAKLNDAHTKTPRLTVIRSNLRYPYSPLPSEKAHKQILVIIHPQKGRQKQGLFARAEMKYQRSLQ